MFSAHKSFSNGDLGEDVSINSGQFVIIVIYYNIVTLVITIDSYFIGNSWQIGTDNLHNINKFVSTTH